MEGKDLGQTSFLIGIASERFIPNGDSQRRGASSRFSIDLKIPRAGQLFPGNRPPASLRMKAPKRRVNEIATAAGMAS